MSKKLIGSVLLVIILAMIVFCGCSDKVAGTDTANTDNTRSSSENVTDAAMENATGESGNTDVQYAPSYMDENELEILTVPPADSQESNDSQESANSMKEPDINDYIPDETKIELPFVPVN